MYMFLPHRWYHGNISRDTACRRLQAVLKPGAYLVRKSESDPGSFVLSFIDKELRVFNYKISCCKGQYNISSQSKRWFSSLQNLIGYYTRYSTVKQNQHLVMPVAPPNVSSSQLTENTCHMASLSSLQVIPLPSSLH